MNNYKHPILAKPSGITLDQHRKNVMSEGLLFTKQTPFVFQKYQERIGKSLARRLEIVCRYHDDGKIINKWQIACQKDYDDFLKWQGNSHKNYKSYSETVKEKAGTNIRKACVRHEFQSLKIHKRKKMPLSLQAAIAAHHGKLSFKHEERWRNENVFDIWKIFRIESNRIIEKKSFEKSVRTHYEFSGPRGLLQLADHRASASEDNEFIPNFTHFKYKFPHNAKRGVQKLIEKYWQNNLLLVRAPTGSGKTDASLLWASLQIENNKADRMVIAMPTRFTSNALAINVTGSLSDTGLYHSSAWFTKFQNQIEDGAITSKEANKLNEFARLLQTPVTVCTIDHLLMALTLTREDHHLITFNLANACLVIDEADFYDDFTQANILVLLEVLRYLDVPVLIMSASLPESVLSTYQNIGYTIKEIVEDTSDNNRNRFEIKSIMDYSEIDDIEYLLELCIDNESAIIYANTVDKALIIYEWFERRGVNAILYHSRFTEPHKKDKETKLINALGKEAWENEKAKGIAILTQIGEMSINISADIMISELCPIDRLTQRAGRLCRFDKSRIGQLYVLVPQKNNAIYPAPYGEYDKAKKSWIPNKALVKTLNILENRFYSAEKLVSLINQVYSVQDKCSPKAISNAKALKEYFSDNWLITSKQTSSTDDTSTPFWKSRNIAPNDTVFVNVPKNKYFIDYFNAQSWKLQNSLELPVYLIDKGVKQHKIDTAEIWIREEKEIIYVIREGFYDYNKGASFIEHDQFL